MECSEQGLGLHGRVFGLFGQFGTDRDFEALFGRFGLFCLVVGFWLGRTLEVGFEYLGHEVEDVVVKLFVVCRAFDVREQKASPERGRSCLLQWHVT